MLNLSFILILNVSPGMVKTMKIDNGIAEGNGI